MPVSFLTADIDAAHEAGLLTFGETQKALGNVSRTTMYRFIKARLLSYREHRGHRYFPLRDIEAMKAQRVAAFSGMPMEELDAFGSIDELVDQQSP